MRPIKLRAFDILGGLDEFEKTTLHLVGDPRTFGVTTSITFWAGPMYRGKLRLSGYESLLRLQTFEGFVPTARR